MMMDGVLTGISSQAIIRAKSSTNTAGRGWTRESSDNVGRSSQDRDGCKLLMTVTATLAVEL